MENHPADSSRICRCVGYAYVPWQTLDDVFNPEVGLMCGTIFPELSLNIEEYGNVCKSGGLFYADE